MAFSQAFKSFEALGPCKFHRLFCRPFYRLICRASATFSAVWPALQVDKEKPAETQKSKVEKAGESFYSGCRTNA